MDEIIKYVMETPENTNPNVLKGILEQYISEEQGDEKTIFLHMAELSFNLTPPSGYEIDHIEIYSSGGLFVNYTLEGFSPWRGGLFANGTVSTEGTNSCLLPVNLENFSVYVYGDEQGNVEFSFASDLAVTGDITMGGSSAFRTFTITGDGTISGTLEYSPGGGEV